MTQDELRSEYERFLDLKSINDCVELCDIFLEHLWNIIISDQRPEIKSHIELDATTINQMMFTKTLSIRRILEGIGYEDGRGEKLNPIVDPTIVASLTRNIFETGLVFNLIYRISKTDDERKIIYGLWESSGLKYRQRFHIVATSKENQEKIQNEKKRLIQIEQDIHNTSLYKSLDSVNKKKIDQLLKDKEYKMRFDGTQVKFLSWQQIIDEMEIKNGLFDEIYTYFSLYSHPSNVSVFQFREMFESKALVFLTTVNMRHSFSILSIFIADYIKLFPKVIDIFEQLDIHKQIAINAYNRMLRGPTYSINNSWEYLN